MLESVTISKYCLKSTAPIIVSIGAGRGETEMNSNCLCICLDKDRKALYSCAFAFGSIS